MGREAIEQFRSHRPDVTLMDLQMPENERDRCPDCDSERISRGADHCADDLRGADALCKRAMKAGRASVYLKRQREEGSLGHDPSCAGRKKKFIHAEVAAELATHAADDSLSEREIEVLSLIAAGKFETSWSPIS